MASKFWRSLKKMAKSTLNTEPQKMKEWKSKLEVARTHYGDSRNDFKEWQSYYDGTRTMRSDPNTGATVSKVATNVRNIVYELIETEVDSSIPMPKVRAIHPEDEELAKKIEHLLENKVKTCKLTLLNDLMERNVPILGGDYFHVQWDSTIGLHSQVGDLKVTEVHPSKLIPQAGVVEFNDMDYFFIQEVLTKRKLKPFMVSMFRTLQTMRQRLPDMCLTPLPMMTLLQSIPHTTETKTTALACTHGATPMNY